MFYGTGIIDVSISHIVHCNVIIDCDLCLADIMSDDDDVRSAVSLGVCWILGLRATVSCEVYLRVYVAESG